MTINLPLKWETSTRAVSLFWNPFWRQDQNVDLSWNFSKITFCIQMSYKRYKPVKYRVICSLFTRQQFIKDRGMQICTPPIWIGLNEFDNSYARLWLSSFFCNYYYSKWYNKHKICNWSVKKKARIGYFLSKVIFPSLYPFSGNFS